MSITVVRSLPEEEWRRFVEENPAGNIFHTPEMFQVFSRTKGYQPELWAATMDGSVLALLLPVRVTLMNGPLSYLTTRTVVYGSVLFTPNERGKEAIGHLLQAYTEKIDGAPLFTELRNLSDLNVIQPILRGHGFVYEDYLNYLIELDGSPEAVMENIGRRTRKHIRRGLKLGRVVVEEVRRREQVAVCYTLLRQSYRKAHVPLADRSLFEAAFELLYPKRMVRFTLAIADQTPIAVSVELLYKDVVLGWYGGLDRTHGSLTPNELVMWNILQWGAENGYRIYDFGGAGRPGANYGVRDFKAKFGGELVCFGRNTCIHSPTLLKISAHGYRFLRRWL